MGFLVFTAPLPSPRLCVNTFKQTLRGGISLLFLGGCFFFSGTVGLCLKGFQEKKGILVFQAKSVAAESFGEKRCEV